MTISARHKMQQPIQESTLSIPSSKHNQYTTVNYHKYVITIADIRYMSHIELSWFGAFGGLVVESGGVPLESL